MKFTPKEAFEVEAILSVPEIAAVRELVRQNTVIADILKEEHVTQAFSKSEYARMAFAGELAKVPAEDVEKMLAEVWEECKDVLEINGITEHVLREVFEKVWVYSRYSCPTNELLEEIVSELEGAEKTAVFASGLAAISALTYQFTEPNRWKVRKGDEEKTIYSPDRDGHAEDGWEETEKVSAETIVVIGSIYGGTYAQLMETCRQTERKFVHLSITDFLEQGLPDDTAMAYFEASNNPTLRVVPIDRVVSEAERVSAIRGKKVITVCDNTFTGGTVRPVEFGVDLSVHSMTKYMNGRSEDLGGSISGKAELVDQVKGLDRGQRMLYGGVMSPRVARPFMKYIGDLHERLYKATQNAKGLKALAQEFDLAVRFIEDAKAEYAERYNKIRNPRIPMTVSNGMITIDFGSSEKAQDFVDTMIEEGIGLGAVSLGSMTTYYSIPAETTHSEMPSEEQEKIGITPGMVRISCGVESDLVDRTRKVLEKLIGDGGEAVSMAA